MPRPRRIELPGLGPEDVVYDAEGRVLTGLEDGRILRLDLNAGDVETIAHTGGRPLGLEACADGSLLICDSARGLLRLKPETGRLVSLVDQVQGEPLCFASNVVMASDGTIYFSASTRRFDFEHWQGDLLEHSGTGRLLRLGTDGGVQVLLDGLQFANGVVLSSDESFVAVAETGAYCVTRLWLKGPRAGTQDTLRENLPGFPDNMARGSDGLIWVSLASPRNQFLDRLHRLPGVFRRALWKLPDRWLPAPERTAWVLALDDAGEVVHDLQTPGDDYTMVTSVIEREGQLFMGSIHERAVAVVELAGYFERSPSRASSASSPRVAE